MAQIAIRLPDALRRRLSEASSGLGVSDEIRRRLEASLNAESIDPKTRQLTEAISSLADMVALNDVWHEDRFGYEVFKAGVLELLARYQPSGEAVVSPATLSRVHYGPGDDFTTAGRMMARWVIENSKKQDK